MASNGSMITVLYKVVNYESDQKDSSFNAFQLARGPKGPTLAVVKQHCVGLRSMNHLGAEGFHWRVCVEDKQPAGSSDRTFGWWDIQDENATLPVLETSQSQLAKLFATPREESATDAAAKVAKGAFKSIGKAMGHAVSGNEGGDHSPPVSVMVFKLLDLVKLHDEYTAKGATAPPPPQEPVAQSSNLYQAPTHRPTQAVTPAPTRVQPSVQSQARPTAPPQQQRVAPTPQPHASAPARPVVQEANLMDFGAPAASSQNPKSYHHSLSSPPSMNKANESRAERLKREYANKQSNSNRVWDEVDQRWVEVEKGAAIGGSASAPPGSAYQEDPNKKKVKGISLDASNAVGKSASVQAAVNQRVNEMKEAQNKALQEIREREEKKKANEAEEDIVRKKLEPKIKAWSEEHGKKKQLRALLGNLHTILWPEADWKPVSIGDILDDSKMKRCFHKASRVVHPDKTHHLDAEKRFLAKRIFDSLSQAKSEFDNAT